MSRPQIFLKSGDDRAVPVAIQSPDGSARDLTGETIDFRAAPSLSASVPTISKTDGNGLVVVDAAMGRVDIVFVPEDTENLRGLLLFDMRVTAANGEVFTADFGDATQPYTYGVLRIEAPLIAQAG